ncbi:MAG: tRNA (N6-threonylcarbamoyladenosine(37)-N6)-methyltransferase TrmO [Clostridiales bacterium]|nr:tRNA (N6-threonylcarbamoyladenosine(37)-N6)-methyltransferase TrmO [Clostridiales bacterium]
MRGTPEDSSFVLTPIAHLRNDFPTKFGLPRQSGLVETLQSEIVFVPEYRNPDALRGLEGYSHLWLIWGFSGFERSKWSPMVRPPRLGGNVRMGVFATRSPNRPNPLGLSCVKLLRINLGMDEPILSLTVGGADLMDGTPIFDIKPYLPYTDCRPAATGGFTDSSQFAALRVVFPDEWLSMVPPARVDTLLAILAGDPRPAYQDDPARRYGFGYAGLDVRFTVTGDVLTVVEVVRLR